MLFQRLYPPLAQASYLVGRQAMGGRVTPVAETPIHATAREHVLDVRGRAEWAGGHLSGATHVPVTHVVLGALAARLGEVPRGRPLVAHCQDGAAASARLRRRGRPARWFSAGDRRMRAGA